MFLGIEIGGTKLQLGVGSGDGVLTALERADVDRSRGAEGIREQIATIGGEMLAAHPVDGIGFGFGGPIDTKRGRTVKSHQVEGWDDFPIVDWCQQTLGRPVILGNDCDCAALAEARFGAGRGRRIVFYVTVGTGIGGGLVIDSQLHGQGRPAVAEIGHLRPGLNYTDASNTVESCASGLALETKARMVLEGQIEPPFAIGPYTGIPVEPLLEACGNDPDSLTLRHLAELAANGDPFSNRVIGPGVTALGWAIAQVITLVAPEVVVVGGGVSLMGEDLFYEPLRKAVDRYVFPPSRGSAEIVAPDLGEEVVVHGAVALAAIHEGA